MVHSSSPRLVVMYQCSLSGPLPMKVAVGRLRDEGFASSPSTAVAHICLYLEAVFQSNLMQRDHALVYEPLRPTKYG